MSTFIILKNATVKTEKSNFTITKKKWLFEEQHFNAKIVK